ncbi:putative tRNA/rRNA methyltransferase [Zhongshania aliphaticivorans]|uniref:Putative tRNA/rRNA methyltransferase n=1 Tax=Zhongshania aliphaticivorans TaxID=1470434 RepID=A0A5S9QD80_9GAMM|nr:23S rRNA (guanosine(2251)-2'-O)-methyltransferase RlmB [Zhongshania aliphaticivorans]CAA0088250.1 putative tRNA/rRNA methyltransferase [Zhongshania aliphaticivorans]CAA0116220.1 putative tRNA/rRNA methyltransferase [Zhongshania aliphaticivorans]CAA0120388.1 putative tRNA/rRNA methyltransferase [Zhongshania aliphaticivorans]
MSDSQYQQRKAFFDQLLTIYGRKPVLEALQDPAILIYKLHLASSNREDGIIREIKTLAEQRQIDIEIHDRKALSRISKNGKQDQGIAADLQLSAYQPTSTITKTELSNNKRRYIALDRITNPQNMGMIIRTVAASGIDGIILPRKGGAPLNALVIKASAGTLFRAPLFYCENLAQELLRMQADGAALYGLSSHAKQSIFDNDSNQSQIYILGNETDGVSKAITANCDTMLKIPMHNGVESLNVAITAALIAFLGR